MNNFIAPKPKKEAGITLVLALLLTGTVTVAALIIAALLVRELHLTDNIRKSLIAYYGAESGLESRLYDYYKRPGQDPTLHGVVATVSSWDINSGLGSMAMIVPLPWETTKEIPLYSTTDYSSFKVESINFCWRGCPGGAEIVDPTRVPVAIEWTLVTLHQDAQGVWQEPGPRGAEISRGILNCENKDNVTLNLGAAGLSPLDRHVLRFKHIDGDSRPTVDFQITMQNAGGAVPFNQETAFKVTGTAGIAGGDISRALNVTISPKPPAYNVFDYVIFSGAYVGKDYLLPGGPVSGGGGVVSP